MTCPQCGAHPHTSAAFCTACGTDLLAERVAHEPISIGSWTPESGRAPGSTTEPVPGVPAPESSDSAPSRPPQEYRAQTPTPVQDMVGSERAEWLDSVWGSAAGVER